MCGNALRIPVRLVKLPAAPRWSLLDCDQANPPLLAPGAYAIDEAAHGRDQVVGTLCSHPATCWYPICL
jgi:hypothetical protein